MPGKPRTSKINRLSSVDAAYIAGFLEADGWITCHHGSGKHVPRVGVGQKNLYILYWLKDTVGAGHVPIRNPTKKLTNVGAVRGSHWRLSARLEVEDFLLQISPYMKLPEKIQRARLIATGKCARSENHQET